MSYSPELLKELLTVIAAQASPQNPLSFENIHLPGHTLEEITEHLLLLKDAACIVEFHTYADDRLYEFVISRLTMDGQKLLIAAKNNSAWKRFTRSLGDWSGFATREAASIALTVGLHKLGLG